MNERRYTAVRAVPAEGARVGLVVCLRCGAAVLLDPADDFDAEAMHTAWHDELERLIAVLVGR